MASFRTGFKIFGELSLKQGLGRIRSFSEDRKPGSWLPEDQWAVRPPGSTCPEPCDKPKKPPKPSKSWLSVCKDPEVPLECDVRHNNCPPPLAKPEGPWYSLDNLIPKKKHEKPPPLRSCREEMKRRELCGEEEEVANVKPYRNYKNGMDPRRKSEYANKVKCSTLKSAQPDPVGINEPRKIMLGLTNEDSACEYEQKSVVPKRKKPRQNDATKVKSSGSTVKPAPVVEVPKSEVAKDHEESSLSCQEPVTQNAVAPEVAVSNVLKQNENSLPFLNDPVPVDDNSKAFMGSLGSWINDLFSTPDNNKKVPSHTSPKIESKPFQPVALPEEDSDYLKTINVLKEQFKKKLKSETSVHISNGDKLLQFNFNECGNKKLKKKLKSLHTVESLVKVAFTKDEKEPSKEDQFGLEVKRQGPSDDLLNVFAGNEEKETSIQLYKAKNELNLTSSNLIKEKKKYKRKGRSNQRMLEEYVFPVPTDLSKRLLLNVDDQEKCSKLYKNTHVGVQENHNAQKSRRSYQNSTRCYTTNASLTDSVEIIPFKAKGKGNIRHSQSSHSTVSSPGKRKTLGTRNNSTFVKVRSQRTASSPHMDAAKIDSKNSSDDLVRYLMKKVKVQHRPQVTKKKSAGSFVQSSALTTGKSKFMQSATSSLVMNVLSKKDNDILLSTKGASRVSGGEKIDILNVKPAYQTKGWNQKSDDAQARLDIKRVSTQNRLNKSTYLSDDHNDLDSNNLFFGKGSKQFKKLSDSPFKIDSKKSNDKHGRKSEGKVTQMKLDKSNIYKMAKIKPKDLSKKSVHSSFLDNYGSSEGKENSSGKFQHQHELFKNSLKSVQQNGVEPESSTENDDGKTNEKEMEAALSAVSPISSDLPATENGFQFVPEESSEVVQCETVGYSAPLHEEVKSSGDDVLGCFSIDDSSLNMSVDKGKASLVDKPTSSAKMKSLQLLKEENTSILLSPPGDGEKGLTLATLTGLESSAGVNQDVRSIKPFDGAPLLNRRPSPNFSGETSKQKKTFLIAERDQHKENTDSGKKQSKDKKKESMKKGNVDKGRDCGFEKTNKPGPNCENEISS